MSLYAIVHAHMRLRVAPLMTVVPAGVSVEALRTVHETHRHVNFAISAPSQSSSVLLCITLTVSDLSFSNIQTNRDPSSSPNPTRRACIAAATASHYRTPSKQLHHQQHPNLIAAANAERRICKLHTHVKSPAWSP